MSSLIPICYFSVTMDHKVSLVTGAFGFSASHLIMELLAKGHHVIATDLAHVLNNTARLKFINSIGLDTNHHRLKLIPANLLETKSLQAVFSQTGSIDNLFHTASLYDYSADIDTLRRVNVEGTRNLLGALNGHKIKRFIHWSTCGVYGKPVKRGNKANLPFTEESSSPKNAGPEQKNPLGSKLVNHYSVSKWEQEQLLWDAFRNEKLPLNVIRPAPIYGPGSDYGHGGIIITISKGRMPAIPLDARNSITASVHVKDLARFAVYVSEEDKYIGEDFNVVDSSVISYHEFLHYIALLTGRKITDIPLLPLSIVRSVMYGMAVGWGWLEKNLNISRVRILEVQSAPYIGSSYWISNSKSLITGYKYLYPDVREGLKDTVAWFRKAGWIK